VDRPVPADHEADPGHFGAERTDHPDARAHKPGRRQKPRPRRPDPVEVQWRLLRQRFPEFLVWLRALTDPRRRPDLCTFPVEFLLLLALLMFCGQRGSRRALGRALQDGRLASNVWRMVGKAGWTLACHPDTLNAVMEELNPAELEGLIAAVCGQMRRSRALDSFRFDRRLTVAIDGAKLLTFTTEHCEHCTHQTRDGVTRWFHYVLVAKIVTPVGLVVPLAFEFVENPEGEYDKQDCELKARARLFEKIDRLFPKLRLNVVGDGLYAEEGTMAECDRRGWNFMITLPDDKLPTLTAQLPPAKEGWTGTRTCTVNVGGTDAAGRYHGPPGKLERTVRWNAAARYHGEVRHAVELEDTDRDGNRVYYNRWVTNVRPDHTNAFDLALTGRLRWKVENEGTNTPKNGGYEMEHAYGRRKNAWKNYFLILQLGQLFNDLVRLTDILPKSTGDPQANFVRLFGSMGHFAECLMHSLISGTPDLDGPPHLARRIRICLLQC